MNTATWFATCGSITGATGIYHPEHEYVEDTIDGGITNKLTSVNGQPIVRWARDPNEGQQLPLRWSSPQRPRSLSTPNDKLYARCKCRGVEFWITRPVNGLKSPVNFGHLNFPSLDNGMEPYATATFEVEAARILPDPSGPAFRSLPAEFGTLRTWWSSAEARKMFCGVCGASVFLIKEDTGKLEVSVGVLAAPEGARAESWLEWPPGYGTDMDREGMNL